MTDFRVSLGAYAGPMDLLLELVRLREIEPTEISIAEITDQYMDCLARMKEMNVEYSVDFLVMAATLLEMKSRSLIPAEQVEDEDVPPIDPRMELIRNLIEYKKVKKGVKLLESLEERMVGRFVRPPGVGVGGDDDESVDMELVNVVDLVRAFDRLLKEVTLRRGWDIADDEVPVQVYMERLEDVVKRRRETKFRDLFREGSSILSLVGMFLALLELVRLRRLYAVQEAGGDILIRYVASPTGGEEG